MVENRPFLTILSHLLLILGLVIIVFPIYLAFVASTWDQATALSPPLPLYPGPYLVDNYSTVLFGGAGKGTLNIPMTVALTNSLISALGIAIGKIAISIIAAFAIVYFRFPFRMTAFWMIFVTLMLPVEVRIVPTYGVVAGLGMIDTYAGLIIPLIASATATFLFRQFFLTVPKELVEAARIDGAGPLRFLWSILLPLSATNIAALFVVLFIYGWNQYLWPLLVTKELETIVVGVYRLLAVGDDSIDWPVVMATAILAMLPPIFVVIAMQRWFVKGLVDSEK